MLTFQYKDDVNQEWYEGMILDISGGGIRFTSKSKLESNKELMNHIRLNMLADDEEELFLSGVIIESLPTELDKTVYENRVEFEGIDHTEREVIIKFIFAVFFPSKGLVAQCHFVEIAHKKSTQKRSYFDQL